MFTILIILFISIMIGIYLIHKGLDKFYGIVIIPFAAIIIGLIISSIIGMFLPYDKVHSFSYPLISLNDNNSINGEFFLGSGHINNEMKYIGYIKINNGIRMIQVNCNNSIIKYSDNPHYEINDCRVSYWGIRKDIQKVFYIPKNSIKSIYNLDGE